MSDSWIIVSTAQIGLDALRAFVEASGGHWERSDAHEWGVVERGDSAIFVHIESEYQSELAPDDLARVEKRLGTSIVSSVSIQIGHAEGSRKLAASFAQVVLRAHHGLLLSGSVEELMV